jgi:hypothetical protein
MHSGPSKTTETVVALLVPPACREEVLGDLYERYTSPRQYGLDALSTIPLVIASRVRRTADLQMLLIQAFASYVSFLVAAWLEGEAPLSNHWEILRLAIPTVMAMLGLVLEDAYANPGRRLPLSLARGPVLGVGLTLTSQSIFWVSHSDWAVPRWTTVYGCAVSLLLTSAVRMLFPPAANQLQGINAPAAWLKQTTVSLASLPSIVRVLMGVAAVFTIAILGLWTANHSALLKPQVVVLLLVLFLAYQLRKRD